MSEFPCDMHGARFNSESTRVFLNAYRGDQVLTCRLSVCPEDLQLIFEPWSHGAAVRDAENSWTWVEEGEDLEGRFYARAERPAGFNGFRRP